MHPLSGAGDRGRTDTVSLPRDFESRTSANSITPAYYFFNKRYYTLYFPFFQVFYCFFFVFILTYI